MIILKFTYPHWLFSAFFSFFCLYSFHLYILLYVCVCKLSVFPHSQYLCPIISVCLSVTHPLSLTLSTPCSAKLHTKCLTNLLFRMLLKVLLFRQNFSTAICVEKLWLRWLCQLIFRTYWMEHKSFVEWLYVKRISNFHIPIPLWKAVSHVIF